MFILRIPQSNYMHGFPQSNCMYGQHPRFRLPKSPETDCSLVKKNCSFVANGSEDQDTFTLSFDVPGVKKEDVSIEEHDGVLEVSAKRKSHETVTAQLEKKYKIDERMVDVSKIKAVLEDGVLNIVLPKNKDAKAAGPSSITITSGYPTEPETANNDANDENNKVNKEFRFSTDLPGVRLDDVEIMLKDDDNDVFGRTDTYQLIIHAKRQKGALVTKIHRQCSVPASLFEMSKIQAFLADGVLTVVAPPRIKVASAGTTRKIHISEASSSRLHPMQAKNGTDSIESQWEEMDINVETVKAEEE